MDAPSFPSLPAAPPLADASTLPPGPNTPPVLPPVVRGPAIPRFVAGYEILGLLGRGGMSVVYKAREVGLPRLVALKMIRSPLASREEQARFRTEAEAIACLQHPNIVQIHNFGEHEGLPYFSLELVGGGSLDRRLDGSPLPPEPAARLVYTLARAMQTAHDKGIVHRDLKPANILLAPAVPESTPPGDGLDLGMPKITDFGLAKFLHEAAAPGQPTQSGAVLGTPSYMAPEQADSRAQDIGAWTDVYALGAILYELLTGRPPFRGATVLDTLEQVKTQDPVAPRRLQPKVPRDLDTLCLHCLRKDPKTRYQRAADLAAELGRYLQGKPILVRPAGVAERVVKWARRRPTQAALLAVGLVIGLALAAALPLFTLHLQHEVRRAHKDGEQDRQARVVADLKADCQRLRAEVEAALRRGGPKDLNTAHVCSRRIGEQISDALAQEDPELAQLREEASRQAAEAKRRLDDLAAGEDARKKYDEFFRRRDEAYFLLIRDLLVSGTASPEACRDAARAALALFRLDGPGNGRGPDLGRYEAAERERLRTGLYEMALLLAEATARSRPEGGHGKVDPQWEKKQAGEAVAVLDRVAAWAPLTRMWRLRRARYLGLLGDAGGAAAERAASSRLEPGTALEWFLSGYDKLLVSGDLRAAAGDLDAALLLDRGLFWAQFLRALAWAKMGQPGEARGALEVCIRERPGFVWSYLFHGLLCGQAGSFEAAAADFTRAETLPLDDTTRYTLYIHRGLVALAQGEVARAVEDMRRAVRVKPDLYDAHRNLAVALAERQDLAGAVAALDEAIRLKPEMAELWGARARLFGSLHDKAAALRDLNEAIRLGERSGPSPELANHYVERARLLTDGGQHAEAAHDGAAAVAILPTCAAAWRLRGEALRQLGQYPEALVAFDHYLALEKPTDPDIFKQRALVRAALGDFAGVPEEYTRALDLHKDADTYVQRAWAYVVNDAMRLARDDFEKALKLAPQHAEALIGRGLVRVTGRDYRRGVEEAKEGVWRAPRSSRLRYLAARVLAQAAATAAADLRLGAAASERRREYEIQAVGQLREALALIEEPAERARFWQNNVLGDRLLVPVWYCPEFVELAKKFPTPKK